MSYHWTFLAVLFAATPVLADPPKSNTLTAQEIADGWILLFDGETTFGWKTDGEVKSTKGFLTHGTHHAGKAATATAFGAGRLRVSCQLHGNQPGFVTWEGQAKLP